MNPDQDAPNLLPEFEPYIRAIGIVAASSAHLEHAINERIWEFTNVTRHAGACITAQMIGYGPRVRCLAALMKLRRTPDAKIREFNSLAAEIESAGRQRNRYLHDQMFLNPERIMFRIEISADRVLKFDAIKLAASEINTLSKKIRKLERQFEKLMTETIDVTPTWPRTQYARSPGIGSLLVVTDNSLSKP
jgi:chromosome condensin MukBEF ATPase and DNA-binding subunit MukB